MAQQQEQPMERWRQLGLTAILLMTGTWTLHCFTTITQQTCSALQVTTSQVQLLVSMGILVSFLFFWLAPLLITKYSLRVTIYCSSLLMILGCCIRVLGALHLGLSTVYTGQFIVALGVACLVTLPVELSNRWFPVHERLFSTLVLGTSLACGQALGGALGPLYVLDEASFFGYLVLLTLALVLVAGVCVLLIKEGPVLPPSISTTRTTISIDSSLYTQFHELLSNPDYMYIIVFGMIDGGVPLVMGTLIESIISPQHPDVSHIGYACAFRILAGAVFAPLLIHRVVAYNYKHFLFWATNSYLVIFCLLGWYSADASIPHSFLYSVYFLDGILNHCSAAVCTEFQAELGHPISPIICGSLVTMFTNGFSLLIILSVSYSSSQGTAIIWMLFPFVLVSVLPIMLVSNNIQRISIDLQQHLLSASTQK